MDSDDWKLSTETFLALDVMWGPHTIDCFASAETSQLERFCSRWWNPGCEAVDAFTVNWEGENVWLCPPIYLVGEVIHRMSLLSGHGTLIIPEWKSAWWWPMLFGRDSNKAIVKNWIYLPRVEGLFEEGTCQWNWFGGEAPRSEVLAVRLCSLEDCNCGVVV